MKFYRTAIIIRCYDTAHVSRELCIHPTDANDGHFRTRVQ